MNYVLFSKQFFTSNSLSLSLSLSPSLFLSRSFLIHALTRIVFDASTKKENFLYSCSCIYVYRLENGCIRVKAFPNLFLSSSAAHSSALTSTSNATFTNSRLIVPVSMMSSFRPPSERDLVGRKHLQLNPHLCIVCTVRSEKGILPYSGAYMLSCRATRQFRLDVPLQTFNEQRCCCVSLLRNVCYWVRSSIDKSTKCHMTRAYQQSNVIDTSFLFQEQFRNKYTWARLNRQSQRS